MREKKIEKVKNTRIQDTGCQDQICKYILFISTVRLVKLVYVSLSYMVGYFNLTYTKKSCVPLGGL